MRQSSYELPCHDFGTLTGVTVDQEQRACRTIAEKARTLSEFAEITGMLGVRPDPDYQLFLREE
jgi:hypothetical protein